MNEDRIRSIEGRVMASIREGRLVMRPRWQFKLADSARKGTMFLAAAGFTFLFGSLIFAFIKHYNAAHYHANNILHWACDNAALLTVYILMALFAAAAYKLSRVYRHNAWMMAICVVIVVAGLSGSSFIHDALSRWGRANNIAYLKSFYVDVLGVDHEEECKAKIVS